MLCFSKEMAIHLNCWLSFSSAVQYFLGGPGALFSSELRQDDTEALFRPTLSKGPPLSCALFPILTSGMKQRAGESGLNLNGETEHLSSTYCSQRHAGL